jgi:hypothetical protein
MIASPISGLLLCLEEDTLMVLIFRLINLSTVDDYVDIFISLLPKKI